MYLSFYYYIYFVINTLNIIVNKKFKNKWKKFIVSPDGGGFHGVTDCPVHWKGNA